MTTVKEFVDAAHQDLEQRLATTAARPSSASTGIKQKVLPCEVRSILQQQIIHRTWLTLLALIAKTSEAKTSEHADFHEEDLAQSKERSL
jgi:hypothetical protein